MSDLNDEAIIAEDSTESTEATVNSVEDSVNDSAEESDAISQEVEESTEDAFDYLDETKTPQAEVDAQNLFKKMSDMTEEQKEEKLKALESRPQTLEALNKLMEAEEPEVQESDPEDYGLERVRFHTSIDDFVSRNKLPDEVAKELKNPVGETSKAFRKMKFDPETGEKLSYATKLKMVLSQSEFVQEALTNQRAEVKAKGIVKATTAKMRNGGGGSTKVDLAELKDSNPLEYLKELDRLTNVGSRYT